MFFLKSFQQAIREELLDGWLFCNFHHRDLLTDSLLDIDSQAVSTREWFYLITASDTPVKIVHSIECTILDNLPGNRLVYTSREELEQLLSRFSGLKIAVLSDQYLQILSTMDAASFNLLQRCNIRTTSAASLIQRIRGVLDEQGIASHERAADALYRIIHLTWLEAVRCFNTDTNLYEKDLSDFILNCFQREGLVTDHSPIIAAGCNSANPHHETGKIRIEKNSVVQFDLWAKYPGGIYADISWCGYYGHQAPSALEDEFTTLLTARDLVKPVIEKTFASGNSISGFTLDSLVRSYLIEQFSSEYLRHRTGHGIDTDCHGSGVNLDSIEFPDNRVLLEGSCFSVEPGVYFKDHGFRTEIDIYIHNGHPVISGGEIQQQLLVT